MGIAIANRKNRCDFGTLSLNHRGATKSEFFECAFGPLSSHPFSLILSPSFPFRPCSLSHLPLYPPLCESRKPPKFGYPSDSKEDNEPKCAKCHDRKAKIALMSSKCCNSLGKKQKGNSKCYCRLGKLPNLPFFTPESSGLGTPLIWVLFSVLLHKRARTERRDPLSLFSCQSCDLSNPANPYPPNLGGEDFTPILGSERQKTLENKCFLEIDPQIWGVDLHPPILGGMGFQGRRKP